MWHRPGVSSLAAITAGLTAPALKKQHTEHVQAASTNPTTLSAQDRQAGVPGAAAEIPVQCPAPVHASQDANLHAAQASDPQSREATPNTASNPAEEAQGLIAHLSASVQQTASGQGQMPDNNTVLWEPLVVKVTILFASMPTAGLTVYQSEVHSALSTADVLHTQRIAACFAS